VARVGHGDLPGDPSRTSSPLARRGDALPDGPRGAQDPALCGDRTPVPDAPPPRSRGIGRPCAHAHGFRPAELQGAETGLQAVTPVGGRGRLQAAVRSAAIELVPLGTRDQHVRRGAHRLRGLSGGYRRGLRRGRDDLALADLRGGSLAVGCRGRRDARALRRAPGAEGVPSSPANAQRPGADSRRSAQCRPVRPESRRCEK
jgi:hypothetical protein